MLTNLMDDVKGSYNTYDNDVVRDFFNRVLKESIEYDRVSAYFSAKSLANMAEGISSFYANDGYMRLIISQDISIEDFEEIKKGYVNRIDNIANDLTDNFDYDNLSDLDKKRIANVAYLIESGHLDVKIAFKKQGIFHDKFGIITDELGESLCFKGSNNETGAATEINYESFDVTYSWLASDFDKGKIKENKERFLRIWDNKIEDLYVVTIPNIIKNKIISYNENKIYYEFDNDYSVTLDYSYHHDSLILDLGSKVSFNVYSPKYIMHLKRYVKEINGNTVLFKEAIPYMNFEKVFEAIKIYVDYEVEKGKYQELVVGENYKKYINEKNFMIDKRYNLGTCIKQENPTGEKQISDKFNEFSKILSEEMTRQLRPKQLWNAFHMIMMERSANFSVPGSGKTSMVYGAFAYLNSSKINEVDRILVICPKSAFLSWKDEFVENFGDKKVLNVCSINDIRKDELIEKSTKSNLILINYESLQSTEESLKYLLNSRTMLVYDEIHKIKGVDQVRSGVALRISSNPKYKYALTGTPIPNGYIDIYNMLNILYEDEYKTFFGFKKSFLKNATESEYEFINKKIYPFFCRTTKKDLEVPAPFEDKKIVVHATDEEKALFELVKKTYGGDPFAYYIRIMQAMINPKLLMKDLDTNELTDIFVDDNDECLKDYNNDYTNSVNDRNSLYDSDEANILIYNVNKTSLYKKTLELIQDLVNENKPVIVWGIFIDSMIMLKKDLKELGISVELINGSVDLTVREDIIKRFKNKEFKVLIANPHTMAESVSLHKCCHDAIYMEYSFNLTHMLQSRDRINRLGLSNEEYTQYYYMFSIYTEDQNKSINSIIYNRLKEKENLMTEAIESGKLVSVSNTIADDIRQLLK